jgi:cysteine-rich repeat protein
MCNEADNQCDSLCGNGSMDGTEDCDDGNTVDADGCTACAIDPGYDCMTNVSPSACAPTPDAGHGHEHDAGPGGDGDASVSNESDGGDGDGDTNGDAGPGAGGDGDGDGVPGGSLADASTADSGAAAGEATDDSTCNCRLPRSSSNQRGVPLLLLGAALLLRRSRRSS